MSTGVLQPVGSEDVKGYADLISTLVRNDPGVIIDTAASKDLARELKPQFFVNLHSDAVKGCDTFDITLNIYRKHYTH